MSNRELDILVAERVFQANITHLNQKSGWCIDYVADKEECNDPIWTDYGADGYRLKRYSEDIKAAWKLVDKMWGIWDLGSDFDGWNVKLTTARGSCSDKFVTAKGKTVMEAICKVALKAVEEQI